MHQYSVTLLPLATVGLALVFLGCSDDQATISGQATLRVGVQNFDMKFGAARLTIPDQLADYGTCNHVDDAARLDVSLTTDETGAFTALEFSATNNLLGTVQVAATGNGEIFEGTCTSSASSYLQNGKESGFEVTSPLDIDVVFTSCALSSDSDMALIDASLSITNCPAAQ